MMIAIWINGHRLLPVELVIIMTALPIIIMEA